MSTKTREPIYLFGAALRAIWDCQAAGGVPAWIDSRGVLNLQELKSHNVDVERLLVSQPDTPEQARETVDTLIRSGAVDLIIMDTAGILMHNGAPDHTLAILWVGRR